MIRSFAAMTVFRRKQQPWLLQFERGLKKSTRTLPIFLLKDVDHLGLRGEIVKVAPGYARNYLVPQKLGKLATGRAAAPLLAQSEQLKSRTEQDEAALREAEEADRHDRQVKSVLKKLTGQALEFKKKTMEDRDTVFEAVSAADISAAVAKSLRIDLHPDILALGALLQQIGDYTVPLRLRWPDGSRPALTVKVVQLAEEAPLATEAAEQQIND